MALVNPNIAMSFRQPEFRPRNALAEYAQVQQIVGGQRQAEMADMQMEELRRERDALGRIQAAIVAKGGPPDLGAAADEMIRTGRPQFVTQGMAIRESLKKQRYFEEFESRFGAGRAAPSAAAAPAGEVVAAPMPSPTGTVRDIAPGGAPGAASRAVFNQDAIAGIDPETQKSISLILDDATQLRAKADEFRGSVRASGFLNQAEQLENQAASMLAVQKRRASEPRFDTGAPATAEQVNAARQALAVGQAPAAANALAPAAAPVTNAMVAPAAQLAVPPAGINQLASAGAGPNIDDLMVQYDLAAKAGHPRAPVILKQIEAALRADPSETRTMQQLGYPLTQEGYAAFRAAQMKTATPAEPSELRTMDALGYPRTREGYAAFRAAQMRETQQQPPALVPILRDGKPVLVPRDQAVGQTPFSPTAVQVLGMGPSAQAPAAAQPRPLTAAQEAARRDKLGKEFKSATAALQTTQDVLDSIAFVRAEPGLPRATGFTGTFLPSIPEGAAAAAETRLKNLEGKVTALGKAQAAATGAIGSIANQEWQILRDQIAAIDRTKGTGPLLKQLELVELQAQGAMARIQDAYQRQFGEDFERFPQFSTLPAPRSSFTPRAPATTSNLSPQEQTELDQLRQRFKGR